MNGFGQVIVAGAAVVALVGAGCSNDSPASPDRQVLPFEQVQASDFVFELDPSNPAQLIFRMTTTEPMICSIAWGETAALGHFNNDRNMAGTGIVEHNVGLPGAEPGTRYHFRVQGTTADGQLYQSELDTFIVPAGEVPTSEDAGALHGTNLAIGATVTDVSSVFSDGWAPENAIDDDMSTEWATAGDGDNAYLVLDLGRPRAIAGAAFTTRAMADGSATTNRFTVTTDGGERFGPFPAGTPTDEQVAVVETTTRHLRFDVELSTGGNTGAIEIRVFAPADADDTGTSSPASADVNPME